MTKQIAIVTGANTGLGFVTALALLNADMHVILACRDQQRALNAQTKLQRLAKAGSSEIILLDLQRLNSVREFADKFNQRHEQLHILVNNAGIMWVERALTDDGIERHMAVNYFGHFLLTNLLLAKITDESSSRIVNLSSIAHKSGMGEINFADINWQYGYEKHKAYAQSKLACLMFANELNRRLHRYGSNIVSVAAHPGVAFTELTRSIPSWQIALLRYTIAPWVTHSVEAGAQAQIHAALADDVKGGEYYGPQGWREMQGPVGHAKQTDYALNDLAAAQRLWDVSCAMTACNFHDL